MATGSDSADTGQPHKTGAEGQQVKKRFSLSVVHTRQNTLRKSEEVLVVTAGAAATPGGGGGVGVLAGHQEGSGDSWQTHSPDLGGRPPHA